MNRKEVVESAMVGIVTYCAGMFLLLILPATKGLVAYPDIIGMVVVSIASTLCLGGITMFASAGFTYSRGDTNANP